MGANTAVQPNAKHWSVRKPLNKQEPERPGKNNSLKRDNSVHATMNSAGSIPLGNNKGQNGDDTH